MKEHVEIRKMATFFLVLLVLLILVSTVGLNLDRALWHDEIYTLIHFSSNGFLYPFTTYQQPNNHILFSALISLIWKWGLSTVELRIPALILYLTAAFLLYLCAEKVAGRICGFTAVVLFISNPAIITFALQLRGYSISWVFILIQTLSLLEYTRERRARWLALYFCAAFLTLGVIPTNLIFNIAISGAGLLVLIKYKLATRVSCSVLLLAPFAGGVMYALVLPEVLVHAGHAFSPWGKFEVLQHFFTALFFNNIALTLCSLASFVSILALAKTMKDIRFEFLVILFVSVTFLIFFWVLLSANTPFPRNLIVSAPIYLVALAACITLAVNKLNRGSTQKQLFAYLLLVVLAYTNLNYSECGSSRMSNLCTPYYNQDTYLPEMTYLKVRDLGRRGVKSFIGSYDSSYAVNFIASSNNEGPVVTMASSSSIVPAIIVARDMNEARQIADLLEGDFAPVFYQEAGYFDLYLYGK